ncbi:DUF222 domain-containing protein [Georgenia yuyongxinii]|uniref:DUF222 domain-containing protein n=1 Tax=Georgenia yuyongxinii TaxID=2589797 RepID=A0A5B8C8H4_9MICO|nr:HNH endonuclease signature motif containing protein [Georgenia yuyongxinii]QDC25442.1 DUF222 domain-containing protein [Georgenia yuyongxinii]
MLLIDESSTPAAALVNGLATIQSTLAELVTIELHQLHGVAVLEVLDRVEKIKRQSEALTARALATIEADGTWAVDGARSMAAWYRGRSGKHHASAAREIRQARALRDHLPATAEALAAGEISVDHASAIVRHTTNTESRREKLVDPEVGEHMLLEYARTLDASDFAIAAAQWGLRADPEAADRAYREDMATEEFHLAETTGGYVPSGWLSTANGKLLQTALDARMGPRTKGDSRTPAQRRAAALTGLASLALDSGVLRPGARIRPHLSVTVPFETLQRLIAASAPKHRPGCRTIGTYPGAVFGMAPDGSRFADHASTPTAAPDTTAALAAATTHQHDGEDQGACDCGAALAIGTELDPAMMSGVEPATFEDGSPIPPALLGRLACASNMHRVVFGPESEVLDVGREKRLFTAAQTRAIIARDKRCQYPRCNAPPGEGEIHHSIWWWAQFGTTSVRLGILLCWFHHDYVHAQGISIERRNGQWVFLRKDGSVIGNVELAA